MRAPTAQNLLLKVSPTVQFRHLYALIQQDLKALGLLGELKTGLKDRQVCERRCARAHHRLRCSWRYLGSVSQA